MADPLLDLQTLIERPTIAIDGSIFEIVSPDELSIVDHQRFSYWGRQINKMVKSPEIEDADADKLSSMICKLSDRIMVGVPGDVRNKLTESQRLRVAEVFMTLPGKAKRAKKAKKPTRRTGAKRARGSNGSTAATQLPG